MTKELIAPNELIWKISQCCYCQGQFTPQEFQPKNYRLFKMVANSELLVMLFHKKCWTDFNQSAKKAWEQIKNDPIYRWSMGKP